MTYSDEEPWLSVHSLLDFGEVTAQWLEGDISYNPAYGTDERPGPNEETALIVEDLAAINRAGFVTTMSQPGVPPDEEGSAQRASLSGFTTFEVSEYLEAATCLTDIIIMRFSPMMEVPCTIPISIWAEMKASIFPDWMGPSPVTTREGGVGGPMDIEIFGEFDLPMLEVLANSTYVIMIDPVWGRNDVLWDMVRRTVCETAPAALTP
jgi:hypothetical protein